MDCSGKNKKNHHNGISRRQLLGSAVAAGAFTIVPSYVLGANGQKPPSEKLNIAAVGIGGMGRENIKACENENIVALVRRGLELCRGRFSRIPECEKVQGFSQDARRGKGH